MEGTLGRKDEGAARGLPKELPSAHCLNSSMLNDVGSQNVLSLPILYL